MEKLLDIQNMSISFQTYRGVLEAIHDVSLCVHAGEVVGIVGESGCGKPVTSQSLYEATYCRAACLQRWYALVDYSQVAYLS